MTKKGLVYCSTGDNFLVKSNGKFYNCKLKGKFRIKGIKSTNPVVVGDMVLFNLETKKDAIGIITSIENRQNYILRKSVKLSKLTHIIAANIDQVFLMITLKEPKTLTPFIDRFLITAQAYRINVILIFNKTDLYNKNEYDLMQELILLYENIGYECYQTVATNKNTLDEVRLKLYGRVSMFNGHSGVGKSTLINAFFPNLNLNTASVSKLYQQGKHTTTYTEMFDLDDSSKIIDTPGIKGFGLVDIQKEELSGFFLEFAKLKGLCKYKDCMHVNEPYCAVKKSIMDGFISPSRYKSYLQILSEDTNYRER